MNVIYAQEPFPTEVVSSIFLAGPTPRAVHPVPSWRPVALALLESAGYQGTVFVPEPRDGKWNSDYTAQIEWEDEGLNRADCNLFWIPRDMETMPALTTNDEWGAWKHSYKVVLGTPPPTREMHVSYQRYYADKFNVPLKDALDATVAAAMERVGIGALRHGAECEVPLHIWKTSHFQSWYKAQTDAGNTLKKARVSWCLCVGPKKDFPVLWVLDVHMHIAAEGRDKTNEVVVGRPDISTAVLWLRAGSLRDTEVCIVREYRTPARTADAFIRELPGGSSKDTKPLIQTCVEELHEEAGFDIDPARLTIHEMRQVAGTLSGFSAQGFSLEVTPKEMADLKAKLGQTFGVASESERTYVEVWKVGDLLDQPVTDWATLGMIFRALAQAMR